MTVEPRHLNFNGGCHGGAIFSLADSAFGLASNSHGPLASGIAAHITYQAGVRAGERLVARATEVSRSRRVAVYRIDVVRPEVEAPRRRSRASPARSRSRPDGRRPRDNRRVLSRRLSSERQLGVKIFLESRSTRGRLRAPAFVRKVERVADLPSSPARPRDPPSRGAGVAREGLRHLADAQLERARGAGPGDGLRPRRGRPAARPAPGGDRREPAPALRGDAGDAGARRDSGAALPGRRRDRVRVSDRQCRGGLRDRRGPGAGRQDDRGARLVPADRAHLVRRPARTAPLPRAGPRGARCAGRRRPGLGREASRLLRRRGREGRPPTSPRCSSPRARPAIPKAWSTPTRP